MTDLPADQPRGLPARLGVTAGYDGGRLVLTVHPQPALLRHGTIRASVVAYAVDCVAGLEVDDDPEAWALTSDMTVRLRAEPTRTPIRATSTTLRSSRRSSTCMVELTGEGDAPVGSGTIGFTKLRRRPTDGPKPDISPERVLALLRPAPELPRPLREMAGIEVVDPAAGVVELLVTSALRNPAGTLQGAMVALLAEAAAEELVEARFGRPALVTDLDVRYLAQAPRGPVRSRSRLLGRDPTDPVLVELVDTSTDTLTTVVYARCAALD